MDTIVQQGVLTAETVALLNGNFSEASGVLFGKPWYVDRDLGDDQSGTGEAQHPLKTIQEAVTRALGGDTVFIRARAILAAGTDPVNYAETIIIPPGKSGLRLIGYGPGVAQGALPQIKKGSGAVAHFAVRSPGCLIQNLGINMGSSTAAGVYLDESSSSYSAFGTVIRNCHFKGNAQKTSAGKAAIAWSTQGGAWQLRVENCRFVDCKTGIGLPGTGSSRPTDVVIKKCSFSSTVNTAVDCDIFLGGGSGARGVVIHDCVFATVDVPNGTGGDTKRYLDLTGCQGIVSNCRFACITSGTGIKTFKAAGDGALVPAEVRIVNCYGEAASDAAHLNGYIIRSA